MSTLSEVFQSLLGPWQFLLIALSFLPTALANLYRNHGIKAFTWSRIQTAWFSAFWVLAGANIRKDNGPRITALLEGRFDNGRIVDTPVVPPLSGVVLEIGPGLGFWVDLFANFKEPGTGRKTRSRTSTGGSGEQLKVYGIEPSTDSHATLKKHIREAGLEDTYEIIPAGIESLTRFNIELGTVDCIVSILCLCGIPEPEKNIAELYKYLKPGGRWYIYEHVQTKGIFMQFYQSKWHAFLWYHANGR